MIHSTKRLRIMPRAGSVALVILVASVCYTSIRLINVTMELEAHRSSSSTSRYILVQNHRLLGYNEDPQTENYTAVSGWLKNKSSFPQHAELPVDCRGVLEGNPAAVKNAVVLGRKISYRQPSDHDVFKEASNCRSFNAQNGFSMYSVTQEELDFPIAYSILLYKDVAQVKLLLKAIYRPHNVYCLHVDKKSDQSVHLATRAIAECLHNVFVVSKAETVVYAGFSRLQADLNCMSDLLASNVSWKYFINLPSQEYPLKSNYEIVKILKIYNGANDIEGITGSGMLPNRYKYIHKYVTTFGHVQILNSGVRSSPPPHNITLVKGSAYGIFSRKFVDFILNDHRSKDLLDWMQTVLSPDEYYWATLHHDPTLQAPGGYHGKPMEKPWLAAYANWGPGPCAGRWMRGVCVYDVGDLADLVKKPSLFGNKFIMSETPVALMCLERYIQEKSASTLPFMAEYYEKLPFIKKS